MKRLEELYLVDIAEASWKIGCFLQGIDEQHFQSSDLDQSAVVYQLTGLSRFEHKTAARRINLTGGSLMDLS